MIVKVIWVLISLNVVVLLASMVFFLLWNEKVKGVQEKTGLEILAMLGLLLILLSAIPLWLSSSNLILIWSGCLAILPMLICFGLWINNVWPQRRY